MIRRRTGESGTNIYPRLWCNDDEIHKKRRTNVICSNMPIDIVPGTQTSFLWARSVPFTDLCPEGKMEIRLSTTRTFVSIMWNTVVVGQEFVLSCLFLTGYRRLLRIESQNGTFFADIDDEWKTYASVVIVSLTFFLITACSVWARFRLHKMLNTRKGEQRQHERQRQVDKVLTRLMDALLLAGLLRVLSGMLRTLTKSYASNTVTTLSVGGMILHLLTCNYDYANGILAPSTRIMCNCDLVGSFRHSTYNIDDNDETPIVRERRPVFNGGMVSINSVFFSTILLVSRLPLSSDASSFVFLLSTLILFAFYPDTRYVITTAVPSRVILHPNLVITASLSISTILLTESHIETSIFVIILMFLTLFEPMLKWWLQLHKKKICGPWDIASVFLAT